MLTFFHGWRRKWGCVTLLMACLVMGLWFRTHFVEDAMLFGGRLSTGRLTITSFETSRQGLSWNRYVGLGLEPAVKYWPGKPLVNEMGPSRVLFKGQEITFTSDSQWWILSFGEIQNSTEQKMSFWRLSFWSLIVPLTLLSGYLLLIPLRKQPSTASDSHP